MPAASGTPEPARRTAWLLPGLLVGWLVGTALQLQQAALWGGGYYAGVLVLGALACAVALAARRHAWARWGVVGAGVLFAFGACGVRSVVYAGDALAPALEGQDVRVTGVIAAMPQLRGSDVRLRFAVESAERDGAAVHLPALVDLTWYASDFGREERTVPALRAGERWRLTVRLKAPHGAVNPHGFDYDLWRWEQGVQASGYVRTSGRLDARLGAPERLAQTWRYPLEQARQRVRDAVVRTLAADPADGARARAAGVVAALVTGDQRAIERGDWQLFRITGVAHLMSISGLHITMFAWLAALLVGWLWRRSATLCLAVPASSAALAGGVLLATAYALFSG